VIEAAGGGYDTVYALTSYQLSADQEVEALTVYDRSTINAIDLTGNNLANTIYGNDGANIIDGKGGNDILYGLGGNDTFTFTTALGGGNVDTIVDFIHGTDRIALDDAAFTGLGLGGLNAGAFVLGTAAQDADDRIVYDSATGNLFYDADGNGTGAPVQFATLSGNPTISASDFVVI
jgi:Ca2+-binding RTX toxin-like protein